MSVFERLNYNFDSNKFGDAQYLPDETVNALKITTGTDLYTWQKERLESNVSVEVSEYRQNPFGNICNTILQKANSIYDVTDAAYPAYESWVSGDLNPALLRTASGELQIEIVEFQNHTANLCGISKFDFPDPNVPTYDYAVSYGRQALNILYQTDEIANAIPILGSFTSLFIENELESINTSLSNVSISAGSTTEEVTGATANINSTITLIRERRLHDWAFYANVKNLVSDYVKLKKLGSAAKSNTEYSLNQLIGTDEYKQNLAIQIVEDDRREYDREYVSGGRFGGGRRPNDGGGPPKPGPCTLPDVPPQFVFNFVGDQEPPPPPDPTCTNGPVNQSYDLSSWTSFRAVISKMTSDQVASIKIKTGLPRGDGGFQDSIAYNVAPAVGEFEPLGMEVVLSECPGDFVNIPPGNEARPENCKLYGDSSQLTFRARSAPPYSFNHCRLERGKEYYINVRYKNPVTGQNYCSRDSDGGCGNNVNLGYSP